jgi:FkbM family methyltransferase
LPQARVLARSYAEHNHGEPCSVLLIDDPGRTVADGEGFEVIRPEQLGFDRFEAMAAMHDLKALAARLRPRFVRYLLERDGRPLACVGADIRFFDDIDEIAQLTRGGTLVLTTHPGFIALAPGADAAGLLGWWCEHERFEPEQVSAVVTRVEVVRDPGVNVGYWDLEGRVLEREADSYRVDGAPLRFFHFSGFDPARPYALSKHQTRIRLPDAPDLATLCQEYAAELRDSGFDAAAQAPWMYAALADGTPLTPSLRRLYGEGEREGAFNLSPFTEAGTAEFIAWCQGPAERGSAHGVTRAALALYDARPDLQAAFPDLDGEDGSRFFWWISHHRQQGVDLGLPPAWLPAPVLGSDEEPVPEEGMPWGVNVAGYLRSVLGVGEHARAIIKGLDARGVPLMPVHGAYVPHSRQGEAFAFLKPAAAPFPVNLICVNADELPGFFADAGPLFWEGRYTIGFWAWEVTTFPERSLGAFDLVDEVWVGSEFVAAALRLVSEVPIVKVRIPVTMPPLVPYSREELGLPDGFLFFFMFDFHSAIERKNPIGLINAFRKAFAVGSGASLVIKSINGESQPDEYDRLRFAAREHPDVHLIDRYVSAQEKDAMLAACDCYVSLHRSEGFGLTPAEAMYLGKPVIATGYSGNLDYMTPRNSYLVDYALKPVGPGNFPYPANGEWADPDVEHAAQLMRDVVENPSEAARRGRQAALDIRAEFSPAAAGETMVRRLEQVRRHVDAGEPVRHPGTSIPPPLGLKALQELIARGPVPREGGTLRRLAQRAALRLMRPVIVHQRQVSERVLSEVAATRRRDGARVASVLSELRRQDEMLQTIATLEQRLAQIESRTDVEVTPGSASGPTPDRLDAAGVFHSDPATGRVVRSRAEGGIDWLVYEQLFPGTTNGVFVDVGAAGPEQLSISALYRELGWRVIAVEPNPVFCQAWRDAGLEVLEYACSDRDQDAVPFEVVDSHGTVYQGARVSFESMSSLQIKDSYRTVHAEPDSRTIRVNVRRLDTLLAEHAPDVERLDVVSVDVEGWELEVLAGLSFERYRPRVLIVENLFVEATYRDAMAQRGYALWRHVWPNDVYVKAE